MGDEVSEGMNNMADTQEFTTIRRGPEWKSLSRDQTRFNLAPCEGDTHVHDLQAMQFDAGCIVREITSFLSLSSRHSSQEEGRWLWIPGVRITKGADGLLTLVGQEIGGQVMK